MVAFLSDEWFLMVANLNDQSDELHLSPALADLVLDVVVDDKTPLHLKQGKIYQGLSQKAATTVRLSSEVLQSLVLGKSLKNALEAFMMGKIRVEGDMSALMSLQSAKPSPEFKQLYKAILAQTQFG